MICLVVTAPPANRKNEVEDQWRRPASPSGANRGGCLHAWVDGRVSDQTVTPRACSFSVCVSANMYIKLESVRRHPRKSTYPVYSMNNSDNANRTVYRPAALRAHARAQPPHFNYTLLAAGAADTLYTSHEGRREYTPQYCEFTGLTKQDDQLTTHHASRQDARINATGLVLGDCVAAPSCASGAYYLLPAYIISYP